MNTWNLDQLCKSSNVFGRKKTELMAADVPPTLFVAWLLKMIAEGVERPGLIAAWRATNLGPDGPGEAWMELAILGPGDLAEVTYLATLPLYTLLALELDDNLREPIRIYQKLLGNLIITEIVGLKDLVAVCKLKYADQLAPESADDQSTIELNSIKPFPAPPMSPAWPPKTDPALDATWQTVLGHLQLEMTKATFETWVRDTCLLNEEDHTCTIGVPHQYAKDWLENRLLNTVKRTLSGIPRPAGEHSICGLQIFTSFRDSELTYP